MGSGSRVGVRGTKGCDCGVLVEGVLVLFVGVVGC